jgi:DNA-binding GntR family transcriptional regulator
MAKVLQTDTNLDIFSTLREELLDLTIKPGQEIVESEVCARFESSRPPVRNAFHRLQDLGLLEVIPYKGVYASLLDLDFIHQMIHMRTVVEGKVIADFIASNPCPLTIEELEHNLRRQQIIIDEPTVDKRVFYQLDFDMHKIWFENRNCQNIWDLIQQQEIHYTRFIMLDFIATNDFRDIFSNHRELLDIIKRKDIDQIDATLGWHLNGGLRRMGKEGLSQYRSYFKSTKDEAFWDEYKAKYFVR